MAADPGSALAALRAAHRSLGRQEGGGVCNAPGRWVAFLSHTQRHGDAKAIAQRLFFSFRERELPAWLDVNMPQRSEAAMREGVVNSVCVVAIITGASVNSDTPDAPAESNAYFRRRFCCNELRWAREAGVPIQPVVRFEDKRRIGEFLNDAPDDLKCLGSVDWIPLDMSDV